MELLYVLLILLVVTRLCSELAVRVKQPALVGELVGGVLIGAAVVAFASDNATLARLDEDETFQAVLDLAVFFLMLHAGIEMRPRDLAKASKAAIPIAIGGMFVPLGLGLLLGWWWLPDSPWKGAQSLFIGVALAITAVPVAVKVLLDLDRLHTKVGQVVVAAAVTDDVLSLILLAILTSLLTTNDGVTAAMLLQVAASVTAFFVIAMLVARYLLPKLGSLARRLTLDHAEFSVLMVFGLALSVLAEALGMHFLIGAFTAGVLFTRQVVGKETYKKLTQQTEALTVGFLAPVFFASIGIHLNLDALLQAPVFLIVLLIAATAGKVLGSGLFARVSGFSGRESVAIGAAMNARGAVEIIIADIALRAGLFDRPDPAPPAIEYLFSAVVIMAIVTTLASPLALRWLLPRNSEQD